METILGILGIAVFYAWIHAVVVGFKKLKSLTKYEKVVLWFALVTMILFVLGSID